MKTKQFLFLTFSTFLFTMSGFATPDPDPVKGKAIFMSRCASCHNVNKVLTGPALAGVDERHSIEWINQFVHSSQAMVKSGDKDAIAIFEKFNKIPMPDHADLSDGDIGDIVQFIKSESSGGAKGKGLLAKPSRKKLNNLSFTLSRDYGILIALLASVTLLIGVSLFAVRVHKMRKKTERFKKFGAFGSA
jgi:mono/diheme cytochrome c family protein